MAEETKKDARKGVQDKKKQNKEDDTRKQIAELNDKLAQEKDSYVRLMAEFETFRRRSAEEKLNLVNSASADTIKELIPVLDACESAVKMLEKSEDEAARKGTELIFNELMSALKKRGLAVIEAVGADFDADIHEAIAQIPAPSPEMKGKVIEVVRTGYSVGGKIIRYPQVVVGA